MRVGPPAATAETAEARWYPRLRGGASTDRMVAGAENASTAIQANERGRRLSGGHAAASS